MAGSAEDDGELRCTRCGEPRESGELDRMLWCDGCRDEARRRAALHGFLVGGVLAAGLAVWILVSIQPSERFILVWGAIVVAAFWLVSRAAREVAYGVVRIRNRPDGPGDSGPALLS